MADFGLSDVLYGGENLSQILQTKILRYNTLQFPQTSTTSARVAMAHRSTTSRHLVAKPIQVEFVTETTTASIMRLEAILMRLRALSQTRWKDLTLEAGILVNDEGDWEYDTDQLTWKDVRIESFDIDLTGRVAVVTLLFVADDPIAYGSTSETLFTANGVSDANIPLSGIDIQGTFYLQYPRYEIFVNSVTPGDNPSLTISNGFAQLTYDGQIANGDMIILDTASIELQRNGNLVDFDGAMPILDVATTQELDISSTYSALDIDVNINYTPRYI